MKAALALGLALLALTPAHAQVFRPQAAHRGPAVSIGGGHWSHGHHGGHRHGHHGRGYVARPYHDGHYGVSYSTNPGYGYYDGYGAGYPYYGSYGGSAAGTGLLLGALAGGIFGHNSGGFHHNGWRGAAWGAGAGWLLGTIVDANRRSVAYQRPVIVQSAPVVSAQPAATPVTIVNNYHTTTPMSAANGLFGR